MVSIADLTPEQRKERIAELDRVMMEEIRRRLSDEVVEDGPGA